MSIFLIIIFIVFCISTSVQLFYYLYLFPSVIFKKENLSASTNDEPVSIIIAAKNETENLEKNLPKILNQNFNEFEVIVVLDQCTDNSLEILEKFQAENKNLKILKTQTPNIGKKHALSLGIENAKHEKLVFIDADCYPAHNNWLRHICSKFSTNKKIVLGLGMFEPENNLLNSFIRYDAQLIALTYMSSAKKLKPYMGVGRNLAYSKKLWIENSGFESHLDIASGDDDLFIIEVATKKNTAICTHHESISLSKTKETYKAFVKQKTRHLSTSKKYNLYEKVISGSELISRFLFLTSAIILLSNNAFLLITSVCLILRILIISVILKKFSLKIKNKLPVFYIIIFDNFALIIYLQVLIKKTFFKAKKNQW